MSAQQNCKNCRFSAYENATNSATHPPRLTCYLEPPTCPGEVGYPPGIRWLRPPVRADDFCRHWVDHPLKNG